MAGGFQRGAKGRRHFMFSWSIHIMTALAVISFSLYVWTAQAEQVSHYTPDYGAVDIAVLLDGRVLTDADYQLIFRQTGLAPAGVEQLREECSGEVEHALLFLQNRFFAEPEITCRRDMFLVWSEWLVPGDLSAPSAMLVSREEGWQVGQMTSGQCFPALQEGDILISFSSHIFGWRSGHAGIVVDAAEGLTLEAIAVGYDSGIRSLEDWAEYPSVAVLRLKGVSRKERARVAEFSREYLAGIPYHIASFTWPAPDPPVPAEASCHPAIPSIPHIPSGTQCAHLVWTAYAHFGYDLDSDGGVVVTPADLFQSDLLEVVQVYGLDPMQILEHP